MLHPVCILLAFSFVIVKFNWGHSDAGSTNPGRVAADASRTSSLPVTIRRRFVASAVLGQEELDLGVDGAGDRWDARPVRLLSVCTAVTGVRYVSPLGEIVASAAS